MNLELTIELKTTEDELIKDMMEMFPEASSQSLICEKWDYKNMQFLFYDEEENKRHAIGIEMLRLGFRKLLSLALNGEYNNNDFPKGALSLDHCNFDATDCDALVQCAIFGEVRYG